MQQLLSKPAVLSLALAAALSACSGTATVTADAAPPPAQTTVAVEVNPTAVEVSPAGEARFAAVVTGTAVTAVTWSVVEAAGGTVDATGRYLAPASAGVFHVRAVSAADPTASATATVTVTAPPPPPPVVTVTAPAEAAVDACRTVALTATVTGAADPSVTWAILEAAGGSVTAAGVYTGPAAGGTYHAVATSVADPTKSATIAVTVTERVLGVQVSPATATVPASGTTQLTATVTTTCGAFASTALLTPQGRVVAP